MQGKGVPASINLYADVKNEFSGSRNKIISSAVSSFRMTKAVDLRKLENVEKIRRVFAFHAFRIVVGL